MDPISFAVVGKVGLAFLCATGGICAIFVGRQLYLRGIGLAPDDSKVRTSRGEFSLNLSLKTTGGVVMATSVAWGLLGYLSSPSIEQTRARGGQESFRVTSKGIEPVPIVVRGRRVGQRDLTKPKEVEELLDQAINEQKKNPTSPKAVELANFLDQQAPARSTTKTQGAAVVSYPVVIDRDEKVISHGEYVALMIKAREINGEFGEHSVALDFRPGTLRLEPFVASNEVEFRPVIIAEKGSSG